MLFSSTSLKATTKHTSQMHGKHLIPLLFFSTSASLWKNFLLHVHSEHFLTEEDHILPDGLWSFEQTIMGYFFFLIKKACRIFFLQLLNVISKCGFLSAKAWMTRAGIGKNNPIVGENKTQFYLSTAAFWTIHMAQCFPLRSSFSVFVVSLKYFADISQSSSRLFFRHICLWQ